jgi:hypothetical protein
MNLLQSRLIIAALLIIILIGGHYTYLYYAAVMIGSIDYLNRQKAFKSLPNFKIFNAIFVGYLAFIAINRSRHFKMSAYTEGVVNIAEHGFFALIICLKLLLYFHLFSKLSLRLKAILVALLFNLIGVMNEIFQSWLNERPLFVFIEDACKDMTVNVLGTILFLILLGLNHFSK